MHQAYSSELATLSEIQFSTLNKKIMRQNSELESGLIKAKWPVDYSWQLSIDSITADAAFGQCRGNAFSKGAKGLPVLFACHGSHAADYKVADMNWTTCMENKK